MRRSIKDVADTRYAQLRDIQDMLGCTARVHEDPDAMMYDCYKLNHPGIAPKYMEFRRDTTMMNLAKIHMLRFTNPAIEDLWSCIMSGRNATKTVNHMVGADLEHLIEVADRGYVILHEEGQRLRHRFDRLGPGEVYLRFCEAYGNPEHPRECRKGNQCRYMHWVKESEMTRSDRLWTQDALF